MQTSWTSLAEVIYKRTYARDLGSRVENWPETVERVIQGNCRAFGTGANRVSESEINRLRYFLLNRKAMPAGRGLWFSGTDAHAKLGGASLNNCWFLTGETYRNLIVAQELLMLGGGVGFSVEEQFVSQLPPVQRCTLKKCTLQESSSGFEIEDSREGWCRAVELLLEGHFKTGKNFNYSTNKIRPRGELIKVFGGATAGPEPLERCLGQLNQILNRFIGQKISSVGMMDLICSIGEMVVAGNVRRSAILILGDAKDEDYLRSKRWDLGQIPSYRAMANLSVVAQKPQDLGPVFWQTYEHGEPFGIVNRANIQKFGRMGEPKPDTAIGVNPCAEATLEAHEPCNLQEIFLPRIKDEEEFVEAARLMHRWGKRVTCENYHLPRSQEVISRNRRVGTSITGCLESPLFKSDVLDRAYASIQHENIQYSKQLAIEPSIRTTVVKPSGTLSLLGECLAGIHPAYSEYILRRVRFSNLDPLVQILKDAGHPVESTVRLDRTLDPTTQIVSFYIRSSPGAPIWDQSEGLERQFEAVKTAQNHWSDQSVSVTVYYDRTQLSRVKEWVNENLQSIKTLSFLAHSDHGFQQAPLEKLSQSQYEAAFQNLKPVDLSSLKSTSEFDVSDCEGSLCPVK